MEYVASLLSSNSSSTNDTLRIRRHLNFANSDHAKRCFRPHESQFTSEIYCNYVRETESCQQGVEFFNYLQFVVCTLGANTGWVGTLQYIIVFSIALACYIGLVYLLAKHFLMPNILYMINSVKMLEFEFAISTVGLLTTSPHLIKIVAFCLNYTVNGSSFVSEMLGKTIMSITMVPALFSWSSPTYHLQTARFYRSVAALLIGLIYSIELLLFKFYNDNLPVSQQRAMNLRIHASFLLIVTVFYISFLVLTSRRQKRLTRIWQVSTQSAFVPTDEARSTLEDVEYNFRKFMKDAFNPHKHIQLGFWLRIVLAPFFWLLVVQIPVVDKERPLDNWLKYINTLGLLLSSWIVFAFSISGVPLYFVVGVIFFLSMIAFVATDAEKAPRLHGLFAVAGIVISLTLFNVLHLEMNTMSHQIFTYLLRTPIDVISLMSNGFNFFVLESVLCYQCAKNGYTEISTGVSMGIALHSIFSILPAAAFQMCYDVDVAVIVTDNTVTCYVFSVMVLVFGALAGAVTDFELRKSHSIFLVSMYGLFLLYACLSVANVMHPYGTIHTISRLATEHANWA